MIFIFHSLDLTEDGLARDTAQVQSLTVIENTSLEVSAHDDKIQVVSREDIDHLVLQTLFLTRFLVDKYGFYFTMISNSFIFKIVLTAAKPLRHLWKNWGKSLIRN